MSAKHLSSPGGIPMSSAELGAVLNTVEQDHRLVLEKMRVLKDAVGCLLGPGAVDVRGVLDRLRQSNDYFAGQFEAHMQEEERALFPFLERQKPEGPALVARLRQEHAEIRRLREEFGKCLAVAFEIEDDPPKMVLRDVLAFGWELWELLDNHAHVETQAVHQGADRYLRGLLVPGEG
jgi:hemerythrin-like domain-containing protein